MVVYAVSSGDAGITPSDLRAWRKSLGLTQARLGRALGVAPNTLARWERGEVRIGNPRLVRRGLEALSTDRQASPTAHPLPLYPGPLIGRDRELKELEQLLRESAVRLLTLTGAGGSGKTRLAHALAERLESNFSGGACWVDLSTIRADALVLPTIARAFGLEEPGGRHVGASLQTYLADKRVLLVLDNCEQVLGAMPALGDLLEASRGLFVLSTSRERLRLRWEYEFPVKSLELPDVDALPPPSKLALIPSVAFLLERIRASQRSFELRAENANAVAEVCVRLDGLPLAIELAAAQINTLTPADLVTQLRKRLDILQVGPRDVPARHRSLRAALDWSYELLSPEERTLFRRVAVFAGGFDLEAAQSVCTDRLLRRPIIGLLGQLVDKSLVLTKEQDGRTRYRLLETVRDFAAECLLDAGEKDELQRRHGDYYKSVADEAEWQLWGAEQLIWLRRLECELDNIRAALDWNLAEADPEGALEFAGTLWHFWDLSGYLSEARTLLSTLLRVTCRRTAARIKAQCELSFLAFWQGDLDGAEAPLSEALASAQELGDPFCLGFVLMMRGATAYLRGDFGLAQTYLEQSLHLGRQVSNRVIEQTALHWLGEVALRLDEPLRAARLRAEGLAVSRALGDVYSIAFKVFIMAQHALVGDQPEEAANLYRESLSLRRDLDRSGIALCLDGLATALSAQGRASSAARLYGAAAALRVRVGAVVTPQWNARHEIGIDATNKALGNSLFTGLWEEGARLSTAEAIACAMSSAEVTNSDDRPLTAREVDVADLIGRGFTNPQIARHLVIGERTVQTHVAHILAKLGVSSRSQIATWLAVQRSQRAAGHIQPSPQATEASHSMAGWIDPPT